MNGEESEKERLTRRYAQLFEQFLAFKRDELADHGEDCMFGLGNSPCTCGAETKSE